MVSRVRGSDNFDSGRRVPSDVTAGRVLGQTYFNSTDGEIFVHVKASTTASDAAFTVAVDSVYLVTGTAPASTSNDVQFVVPLGSSYSVDLPGTATLHGWIEFRNTN